MTTKANDLTTVETPKRTPRGKRIGFIKVEGAGNMDIYIHNKAFQLVKDNKFIRYVKDSFVRKHGLFMDTEKGGLKLRYNSKEGYIPVR